MNYVSNITIIFKRINKYLDGNINPDQYIAQLKKPRLIMCKECKYAVGSYIIDKYFTKAEHRLFKFIRKIIAARVKEGDQLIEYSNELKIPRSVQQTFDLLHLHNDELLCQFDEKRCHYICCSMKKLFTHLRKKHHYVFHVKKDRPNVTQQKHDAVTTQS